MISANQLDYTAKGDIRYDHLKPPNRYLGRGGGQAKHNYNMAGAYTRLDESRRAEL